MKYDIIIIGGDPGDAALAKALLEKGHKTLLICSGRLSADNSREEFRKAGGTLLLGDSVANVQWQDGKPVSISTENLKTTTLQADTFILCSGRFFTRGLLSDDTHIWEPVFGCDVQFDADRSRWCDDDFFSEQPFESFGVMVNAEGKVLRGGEVVDNLWACGGILCDKQDNWELICRNF